MQFHLLPEALRGDTAFARQTGLADCKVAAMVLHEAAVDAGFESRIAAGYVLTGPYATWHAWFELRQDHEWVVADPFFIRSLHRWNGLDTGVWSTKQSPRAVYWRIGEQYSPMLNQDGRGVFDRTTIVESWREHG
jgi:hypothetical protein